MKIIIGLVIFINLTTLSFANNKIVQFLLENEKILQVKNVKSNDTLNLREKPTSKSNIICKIPYNAFSLNKISNIKEKNWIKVKFYDKSKEKDYYGWVHKYYLEEKKTWKKSKINGISLTYPSFFKIYTQGNIIYLTHRVKFKYEQYLDGRYGVSKFNKKKDFYMTLQLYDNLQKALKENYLETYDLKKEKYGNVYTVRTGVEGIGDIYHIVKKDKKIYLFILKYNINPITPLQNNIPFILTHKDILALQKEIVLKFIKEVDSLAMGN